MRIVRLLASTCVIFLAVAMTAQETKVPLAPGTTPLAETQIAPPAHPATEDQIREYMQLSGALPITRQLMDKMVHAMQLTAAPYYPASMWDDMRAEFAKLDIISAYVPLYQRYFSQEDMQKVLDFYRSPAGKNLLAIQPLLIHDAQGIMRQKGQDIGLAVYNRHKDEIEAAKKLYDNQHPLTGNN